MKKVTTYLLTLLAVILMCSTYASAQETQREKNRSVEPTVTGGSGLFTVYDATTLKRTEFNIGVFYNNFDRDPGDVDISQGILNVGIGLTDRLEFFASSIIRQQATSARPEELSGFLLPNVRFPAINATPVVAGAGSSAGAPFVVYPGYPVPGGVIRGALVGSVLPGLPSTGGRIPGYLNDYPFLGRSNYTSGNTTIGGKFRFTSPDSRVGVALIGFIDIPVSTTRHVFNGRGDGIVSGSGAGSPDYGMILAVTPRFGLATVSMNVGAVKTGDPTQGGIKFLDRRNKFIASVGLDIPFNQYFQFVSELTSNIYYGSGTPNQHEVNPVDLTVGARFVPFGKNHKAFFSMGGAYRYNLNNSNDRRPSALKGDFNGFVLNAVLGYRKIEKPDPCKGNVPPTVTVSGDKMAVKEKTNESVSLVAVGKDPDAADASLSYSWSASSGSISGSGSNVSWTPGSSAPGDVTITVTVNDSCSHSASASTSVKVEKVNNCPTVTLSASPSSIREGSDTPFTFTARGNDIDGDSLSYKWSASRGSVDGSGSTVSINTRGLSAGSITVTVSVNDGQCSSDTASATVEIIAPPPPPPVYTTSCDGTMFKRNISRVDNQCKAVLDGVVDRLRADPTAVCLLDGNSDKGEKPGTAQARAEKVKAYLIEKGIDANRIETRSFDDSRPDASGDPKMNCRVMIHIIPAGAKRPE